MACKFWIALTLSLVSVGAARAGGLEPGWHDDQSIEIGDETRYYRVFVPGSLPDDEPPPMVMWLHGGTQSMREVMPPSRSGSAFWPTLAETERFILLVPNGYNEAGQDAFGDDQGWNDCRAGSEAIGSARDDVAFLTALLDHAVESMGVDPDRRFVSGASNGGMMTYRLMEESPQHVSAAAVFIANRPDPSECDPAGISVPLMMVNGTADAFMPYAGGPVANNRGTVAGSRETLQYWLDLAGLDEPDAVQTLPDLQPADDSVIEREIYRNDSTEIRYYSVQGGGHAMPSIALPLDSMADSIFGPNNRDLEGAREAWSFFESLTGDRNPVSGIWFDPESDGEGLSVIAGGNATVIYYYGRTPDGEGLLWLISEAHRERLRPDSPLTLELYVMVEGTFDQPTAPDEGIEPWGTLTIEWFDAYNARAELTGLAGERKTLDLIQLLGSQGRLIRP